MAQAASRPGDRASASQHAEVDQDAARLLELGYQQELRRRLDGLDNGAMGFAMLGLESTAIGSLIVFGTAAIYVSFLLVALAALVARTCGNWKPGAHTAVGGLIYLLVARPYEKLEPRAPRAGALTGD